MATGEASDPLGGAFALVVVADVALDLTKGAGVLSLLAGASACGAGLIACDRVWRSLGAASDAEPGAAADAAP